MTVMGLSGKIISGAILMLAGIALINTNMRMPLINEITPGNALPQMIIALALIVLGFTIFVKSLKITRKQNRRIFQNPRNEFLEIFGLE